MSLFKKPILKNYNVMHYTDKGFLLLHCSRNDVVCAPFKGEIDFEQNGCVIYNDRFKLYISHIIPTEKSRASIGDMIGTPMVERNMAYIGIKIYKDGEIQDPLVYLNCLDKDEPKQKVEVKVDTDVKITSEPKYKKKSNRKRK